MLLAAEIIHSSYDTHYTTVINQADVSDYVFIPKEAIKYKGHHYLVFSDIGKSMEDAQQFCESMGGHLATVGDDDKNERLFRLINDSGYMKKQFRIIIQTKNCITDCITGTTRTLKKTVPSPVRAAMPLSANGIDD